MDKISRYKKIIREEVLLQETYRASDLPDIYNQAIVSEDQSHYLLITMGWHQKKYIHTLAFHLEVKEDKVWIHEDKTDTPIANRLIELGVDASDIVFGFEAPYSLPEVISTTS